MVLIILAVAFGLLLFILKHVTCVAASYNKAMANIFGDDVILAFDNFNMSYVYQLLNSDISNFIVEINRRDLLPRPIGIDVSEIRIKTIDAFGFGEFDQNFYDGNFFDGTI